MNLFKFFLVAFLVMPKTNLLGEGGASSGAGDEDSPLEVQCEFHNDLKQRTFFIVSALPSSINGSALNSQLTEPARGIRQFNSNRFIASAASGHMTIEYRSQKWQKLIPQHSPDSEPAYTSNGERISVKIRANSGKPRIMLEGFESLTWQRSEVLPSTLELRKKVVKGWCQYRS